MFLIPLQLTMILLLELLIPSRPLVNPLHSSLHLVEALRAVEPAKLLILT
jgi:hypothetical protein